MHWPTAVVLQDCLASYGGRGKPCAGLLHLSSCFVIFVHGGGRQFARVHGSTVACLQCAVQRPSWFQVEEQERKRDGFQHS